MSRPDWRDARIAELEAEVARLRAENGKLAALAADGASTRDRAMLDLILAGALRAHPENAA